MNWMREKWRSEDLAQGLHGQGLGEAGHALHEQVPPAEERHHHPLDQRPLADDDLAHLVAPPPGPGAVSSRTASFSFATSMSGLVMLPFSRTSASSAFDAPRRPKDSAYRR